MNSKLNLLCLAVVVVMMSLASFADAQGKGRGGGGGIRKDRRKGPPQGLGPAEGRGRPDGRRDPPGGRRERPGRGEEEPEMEGDFYQWTREVETPEVTLEESAFVATNSNVVVMKSSGAGLDFINARSIYDFNSDPPVLAYKIRGRYNGPCFIQNSTLVYQDVIDTLNSRNNTNVTTAENVTLDGTGESLNDAEIESLFESNPALQKLCGTPPFGGPSRSRGSRRPRGPPRTRPVIVATPYDPTTTVAPDVVEIEFFDINSRVTLLVQPPRRRGPFGPRRPGDGQ